MSTKNILPSKGKIGYIVCVSAAVLHTFFWSCIESVLTFLFPCWFGGLNVKSKNVLNKVVNVCGRVVGE